MLPLRRIPIVASLVVTAACGGDFEGSGDLRARRVLLQREVDGLRAELADSDAFRPGRAVAAAHAAIRERIAFLHRDRAMDGEVAAAVRMVADGSVLNASRAAMK